MRDPILNSVKWILARPEKDALAICCQRCGREDRVAFPIPVSALPWLTRGFQEIHRNCREKK